MARIRLISYAQGVRGLVAALALVMALLGSAAAQETARPTGRIVVPRDADVWAVLAASGVEQLVASSPEQGPILDAALSPDGRQVVYARLAPSGADDLGSALYVVAADGGAPRLLLDRDVRGATLTTPIWAADGASILYTYTPYAPGASGPDAEPRIERIRLDGSGREVLIPEATTPAPSADGYALAYLQTSRRGDALWLADANGQNGRELVPTIRFLGLAYPRVSPDGTQIAFVATVDLASPSGPTGPSGPSTPSGPSGPSSPSGPATPLLPRSPFAWHPAPGAAHGLPWDVWLIGTDGGGLQRLTYLAEDDPSVAWSPDGAWLAIQGGYGLTLLDVSSGRTERLSRAVSFGAIDWGRD
jgi:Tol biopolymer transport system component